MTKRPCDPIAFSLARKCIVKIVAVYMTLWPVTERGLLDLCYSSDLQVTRRVTCLPNSLRLSALRDCRYALVVLHSIITPLVGKPYARCKQFKIYSYIRRP